MGLPMPAVLCLSPDLLYEVFKIASEDPSSQIVLAATQVCHQWRSVAINAPKLWAVIRSQSVPSAGYLEIVWLPRAQDMDLAIDLTGSESEKFSPRLFLKIFAALLPTAGRWKQLTIRDQPLNIFVHIFLRLDQHPLISLKKLTTLCRLTDVSKWGFPLHPSAVPHLTFIETSTNIFDFTNTSQLAVWKGLREVRLHYILNDAYPLTLSKIYAFLTQISSTVEVFIVRILDYLDHLLSWPEAHTSALDLPCLVHLEFPAPSLYYPFDTSLSEVFHPMIRYIRAPLVKKLEDITLSALPVIAQHNPFPRLEHLELLGRPRVPPLHMGSVGGALSQLSCLRTVRFHSIEWPAGEYARALEVSCSSLVDVALQCCGGVLENDLRTMVELRRDSNELASLQSLHIVDCEPLDIEEDGEVYQWFLSQVSEFRLVSFYMSLSELGL